MTRLINGVQSGPARIGTVQILVGESFVPGPPFLGMNVSGNYVMGLLLTDEASQRRTTLTFPGHIAVHVDGKSNIAFLSNHFLEPPIQSAVLGGNRYTVSLSSFGTAPSSFTFSGGIAEFAPPVASVSVTPEPSTMLLASLGLVGLTAAVVLRRRYSRCE
jgi:hypothetical protein